MSSYWDYLGKNWYYGPVLSFAKARYEQAWDESHGSDRYWLSKVPVWGQFKKWQDEARYWQDSYENTGKDPNYSSAFGNSNPAASLLGTVGAAAGVAKMARSLTTLYTPEVVEDVCEEFNYSLY